MSRGVVLAGAGALVVLIAAGLTWSGPASGPHNSSPAESLPDRIAAVKPSVVAVGVYNPHDRVTAQFVGTGFAVAGTHYVATNWHVVRPILEADRAKSLRVFLPGEQPIRGRAALLARQDPEHDLALIEYDGPAIPGLELGDDRAVREGHAVAFTGYPLGPILGLHPATHTGIVSSIGPRAIPADRAEQLTPDVRHALENPFDVFALDAVAFPGNSGSPIYRIGDGKVIAIISNSHVQVTKEKGLVGATGICYGIPVAHLAKLLQ